VLNVLVLVSGGGTNLQAILERIADGGLPNVRIVGVLSSRDGVKALERARLAGIPTAVVTRSHYADLTAYYQAMLTAVDRLTADSVGLVVLAGFLSLLGPGFVHRFAGRIINVHPALIPSFCGPGMYGIRPHEAALARGVRVTGATVHLVDEAYDEGPILLQKAVDVHQDDTPETLQQRVMKEAEQVILPEAVRLFAEGRVAIEGRKVHIREVSP